MVNSSRHFAYVSGYGMLDAEMDERGNLYTLEAVNVLVFPLIGADQRDSILSVKRNGEIIASYDLMPMFGPPTVSGPTDLYSWLTYGLMSLVLTSLYAKYRNFYLNMSVHLLWNLFGLVIALMIK